MSLPLKEEGHLVVFSSVLSEVEGSFDLGIELVEDESLAIEARTLLLQYDL